MLLLLPFALAWTSASTSVSATFWTVTGQDGYAVHTHGGAPARLSSADFMVTWGGAAPTTLTVEVRPIEVHAGKPQSAGRGQQSSLFALAIFALIER